MRDSSEHVASDLVERNGQEITVQDLGNAQWALIRNLERQHQGEAVYGSKSKFEYDTWVTDATNKYVPTVYWSNVHESRPALKILIKAFAFESLRSRRLELSAIKAMLWTLSKTIFPVIENKSLLLGKEGDVLVGLSNITDEDLLLAIDTRIASTSTLKNLAGHDFVHLADFLAIANHIGESVPVYQIRANLPWKKAGMTVRSWVERRANDLKISFRPTEGFAPLQTDTVMPIIEMSLNLINDYYDQFSALAKLTEGYTSGGEYVRNPENVSAQMLLVTYGPIFRKLIPPPVISHISHSSLLADLDAAARAVFGWFRELLYLARGACVNVILLTTGLRNVDVRALKVDACRPSGRIDMLFYLYAEVEKTKNIVLLPVPAQTSKACSLLANLKLTSSPYLLDGLKYAAVVHRASAFGIDADYADKNSKIPHGDGLNRLLRDFAAHFNIPFIDPRTGENYSAHCYRTTVAGWLGATSNLAILMVRRLFGHNNYVMPTVYLRNNPAFLEEQKVAKESSAAETARQMAFAASRGQLAGSKGYQLERGYNKHISRLETDKKKSHSMTDTEIVISFADLIQQRILNESVCGFLTPFGVRCMRNPSDTSQPPCAKRSHGEKVKDIDQTLLTHLSDIDPQNCIGTSCNEAMIGPWSESIKESLLWYRDLLRHQLGDSFTDEHFREHAVQFIRQYGPPIKKVFGVEVLLDITSTDINGGLERKNV